MSNSELLKEILRQSHRVASRISPTGELLVTEERFLGDLGKLIALEFSLVENGVFTEESVYQTTLKAKEELQK